MQQTQITGRPFINTAGLDLLGKRLNAEGQDGNAKPSVRLYFIKKLSQYLSISSFDDSIRDEEVGKIGAVGEYCITIMYLDNHLQDGKYGVTNEASIQKNRAERAQTKDALDHYILTQFSGYTQERISQTVEKLFWLYEEGMKLDKYALTYENYQTNNQHQLHRLNVEVDRYVNVDDFVEVLTNYKPQKYGSVLPQKNYLRLLLTRAFLINAVFFQVFAELMIDLYGNSLFSYPRLIEYARMFGIAQQLVNDNCDFLPISYGYTTVCKLPEDTFSDIRRGLITLPMMLHLNHSFDRNINFASPSLMSHSRHDLFKDDVQRQLLWGLKSSKALGQSMGIVCAFAAYGELLVVDEMFRDMFSFVRGNRFYQAYSSFTY